MSAVVRNLLRREAVAWHQAGRIDRPLLELLLQRYAARGGFLAGLLKWLGVFAVLQLGLAVLALIALWTQSATVGALLLAGVGIGSWWSGVRLATDPRQHYPHTGAVLVTASLAAVFGALVLLATALYGPPAGRTIQALMLITSALGALTAYRYHLRWPLLLALLLGFHGLGLSHSYAGAGSYFVGIDEPRLISVVALFSIVLGVWHERQEAAWLQRYQGFGSLYLVFGLLYLDLALWFLTLPRGPLFWALLFAAAAIGQIVIGARWRDGRWSGFGVVFLAINLYTRYFEHFWDRLSLGLYFLVGGILALAVGLGLERWVALAPLAAEPTVRPETEVP